MKISTCLHPVRIYNKYLGQYQYVPCGTCLSCRAIRRNSWVKRLEQESIHSRYSVFFTLTYDDECLPKFVKHDDVLVSSPRKFRCLNNKGIVKESLLYEGECFPISEIDFSDKRDLDYFNRYDYFSYPVVQDIQKFVKRVKSKLNYEYKKLSSFSQAKTCESISKKLRYYIVSEYGPNNQRVHYHGLFFFNEPFFAERIEKVIFESWLLCDRCFVDVKFSNSQSSSYVAKYIGKSCDLPSVFRHRCTRPFAVFSKHPFIGFGQLSREQIREIIDKSIVCVPVLDCKTKKVNITRVNSSFERRYFPRCYAYSFLDDSSRILLYKSVFESSSVNFMQFKGFVFRNLLNYNGFYHSIFNWIFERVKKFHFNDSFYDWYDVFEKVLKRIYLDSVKVVRLSIEFGFSLDDYCKRIISYYNASDSYKLLSLYKSDAL